VTLADVARRCATSLETQLCAWSSSEPSSPPPRQRPSCWGLPRGDRGTRTVAGRIPVRWCRDLAQSSTAHDTGPGGAAASGQGDARPRQAPGAAPADLASSAADRDAGRDGRRENARHHRTGGLARCRPRSRRAVLIDRRAAPSMMSRRDRPARGVLRRAGPRAARVRRRPAATPQGRPRHGQPRHPRPVHRRPAHGRPPHGRPPDNRSAPTTSDSSRQTAPPGEPGSRRTTPPHAESGS
jgi:hypothetical protein